MSNNSSGVAMDQFTYITEDGWEITLIYDSSADDADIVRDIKSLIGAMAVKQVIGAIGG